MAPFLGGRVAVVIDPDSTASLVHADVELISDDLDHLLSDVGLDVGQLGTVEELVRIWYDLTKILSTVKTLTETFDEHLATVIQKNAIEVNGIGILSGHRLGTDTWDKDQLPAEVAARIAREVAIDFGGELIAQQAARRAADRAFEIARPEWRKGDPTKQTPGLKSLGINPNDFLVHTDGRWKLDLAGPR
jgi:hypothetical protein